MVSSTSAPLVAIVGRQNVGKSTLYNRLLGKRIAITDQTPGVTRDALCAPWYHRDIEYQLCDTGGQTMEGEPLDHSVTQIARDVCRSAEVILFVLDINQITPEDMAVSSSLMPYRDRVICVLNKADRKQIELLSSDFFRLGFDVVIPISAQHNRNVNVLKQAIPAPRPALPRTVGATDENNVSDGNEADENEADGENEATHYRMAIIGKQNSGKSTLANALHNTPLSLVSDHPGTTRDAVRGRFSFTADAREYTVELVDTAGMRRSSKITENLEFYAFTRTKEAIGAADIVLLLIDATLGVTDADKKIAQYAAEYGKGIIFVYNKIDLSSRGQTACKERHDTFRYRFPHLAFVPLVEISALKRRGLDALKQRMAQLWTVLNCRVPTPRVNTAAREWMEAHVPNRRSRFTYATQISTCPLKFLFFFKHLRSSPGSFSSYLTNNLRKQFHLDGAPILIELREGRGEAGARRGHRPTARVS